MEAGWPEPIWNNDWNGHYFTFYSTPHTCRLDGVGFEVGVRLIERISLGERVLKRKPEVCGWISVVGSVRFFLSTMFHTAAFLDALFLEISIRRNCMVMWRYLDVA